MKLKEKSVIFIFLSFIIYHLSFITIYAQREVEDYHYQYEEYGDLHEEFVSVREKYLQYKTLATKDEALKKTKQIILQRAEVLQTYLIALKSKVDKSLIFSVVLKEQTAQDLASQIDWLEGHKEKVAAVPIFEHKNLFKASNNLEQRQTDIFRLIYQSLFVIRLGKIQEAQQESVFLWGALKEKVVGSLKEDKLTPWLVALESKNRASEEKSNSAKENLAELDEATTVDKLIKINSDITDILDQSVQELREAFDYEDEIYQEIKVNK